ncbi:MAG: FHA domain-containing protein [Gemmatimonadaceae bacterium]
MPLLISGADRCALEPGTHTIGGRGADALLLSALEWQPAVAAIIVPRPGEGPTLIRRTTASVIVRLDGNPLGIAPAELADGATIEFADCHLTFDADITGISAIRATGATTAEHAIGEDAKLVSAIGARVVHTQTGQAFALTDRRVVIGRDDSCDVVLHGKGLSRRHASISPSANGYVLRDQSANGTKVNGTLLAGTRLLAHGDVVQLVDDELRFEVEGMAADDALGARNDSATQILDLSRIERITRGVGPGRRMSCSLEIVSRQHYGTMFELDKPVFALGRGAHNDVVLRDDSVSLTHATLLRKGNVWYVLDLGSANGTSVDGSRVSGERVIVTGSRLKVAGVEMVFRSYADGLEDAGTTPVRRGFWRWVKGHFAA